MKIQIFGTGCPKCLQLANNVKIAIEESGIDVETEKITEITDIIKFGVMMTPALAVDGNLKFVGKLPSIKEIKETIC